MGELSKLPNIGPMVEAQLCEVGVDTAEKLLETGAKAAWMKIRDIDHSACINRLYGLEGAVRGIPKKLLPDEVKAELKEFYNRNKWKEG